MSATKEPCGECHLQPGETCDICGVTSSEPPLLGPADPPRSGAAEGNEAEAAAPKPDPATAALAERLREDAEYLDNYFGFVGNQYRIVRNISDLIAALTASNDRVAEAAAWLVERASRDGKKELLLPLLRSREEMERYRQRNPEEFLVPLYTHPAPDTLQTAEAEVSRLRAAFRDISSFSPDPASNIGPFEQIARHARATTLAALSNQAGASK